MVKKCVIFQLTSQPMTTVLATFTDDTCFLSSRDNHIPTSRNLQDHLRNKEITRWRIKVNGAKSAHITFTLCRKPSPPLTLQFLFLLLDIFAIRDSRQATNMESP